MCGAGNVDIEISWESGYGKVHPWRTLSPSDEKFLWTDFEYSHPRPSVTLIRKPGDYERLDHSRGAGIWVLGGDGRNFGFHPARSKFYADVWRTVLAKTS